MSHTIVIDVSSPTVDQEEEEATIATDQLQQPQQSKATMKNSSNNSNTATTAKTIVKQRSVEAIVDDFTDDGVGLSNGVEELVVNSNITEKCNNCRCHVPLVDKQVTTTSCKGCHQITSTETATKTSENTTPSATTTAAEATNELSPVICKKNTTESPCSIGLENIQQLNILTGDTMCLSGAEYCQSSPNKSINNNNEKICRICLDNVDEGDLIAPCKCSGSTKYAHESCLLKWFFKSSKKSCEVCLGNVNVTPVGYKPVQEWRLPGSGCDFIVYLFGLYFLIMVIFTGMITWIATQGCTSPVCVTLYCVCGIAVFYFFYCCGCVEYSRRYWKALLSVNKVWRIYGREDSIKNLKYNIQQSNEPIGDNNRPNLQNIRPFVIDINENETNKNNSSNKAVTTQLGVDNYAVEIEEPGTE